MGKNSDLILAKGKILDSGEALKWLQLVDNYIEIYNRHPKIFVLPQEHALLAPVIEAFKSNLTGFKAFIREIRDEIEPKQRVPIHEEYRRINSRLAQQSRRERLFRAIEQIEAQLGLRFTSGQRSAVVMWLTQYWGKMRLQTLEAERVNTPEKKLSSDVRTEIGEQFWDEIDGQLDNNITPIPPEIVYAKLPSLESYRPGKE